eukprot:TRINITY_DN197_c0_g1_i5.p1 TRINITY_DN197_c0_g1~~TRINITY_DN197_c0_g1_i5.p1  ORF type:complete len:377 (-),score=52.56 TRINITY_DN197_c0_g1_i5:122-1225(-)
MTQQTLLFISLLSLIAVIVGVADQNIWIAPQNAARASYGLPAFVVDPYLTQLAQQYTDTCVYALPDRTALATAYRTLTGLTAPTFGRNLGKASRGSAKPTIWLDQKSSWTCSSNTCSGSLCGIWTQIIWATSTKIGCGLSSCPNNEDIFVCIYTPAGNSNGAHPSPVVPPPPPATGTINYQVWIEPQNAARATYGLPALVVDPYLAQLAQQYTDTCVYALPDRTALATAYRTLTGLTAPTFGRNLGKASRGSAKPTIWLDQKSSWTCSSNTCSGSLCGIWTQIIWATSTKIGCGLSSCPNNEDIFVCIYTPAGNTNGVHPFGTETWRCNSPITSFQSTEVETTHARTRGRARGRARSRSSRGRTNYF